MDKMKEEGMEYVTVTTGGDDGHAPARRSYEKAKSLGDENVYFIDGQTLFDGEFYDSCTSDGCHPNDIGFIRMADKIGAVVAKAMNLIK